MKILVVRFSSIGDIVLTTPIVRCLKNQLQNAEIHYVTKSQYKDILKSNPYIDHVHSLENSFSQLLQELRKEKFDYVIDLHKNLRTLRLKLQLMKKSYAFNKLNIEKYLMVKFKWNLLPDLHIVDRYFKSVSKLQIVNDGLGLDYFIPEYDRLKGQEIINKIPNGFYAIVLGGKFYTKKFPVQKVIELIEIIQQPIVLLGGKDEIQNANVIEQNMQKTLINFCGKISLNESAYVISRAEKIITNDTGLMHIAAAFKKKIISIWGNTIPEFGMYPYYGDHHPTPTDSKIVEIKNLKCRPCSKLGYKNSCPKKHFNCMKLIDSEEILN